MSLPLFIVRFFVVFFILGASLAAAQQQQSMIPYSRNLPTTVVKSNMPIADYLDLKVYEAAKGDLSACSGDKDCINNAQQIRNWFCAADVCEGKDKGKEPTSCFKGLLDQQPVSKKEVLSTIICPVILSPSKETRKALMSQFPNMKEEELVESAAYLLAVRKSAEACEDYIKNYLGTSNYKLGWYKVFAGCRILANQSSRKQEENDFSAWVEGKCSSITNSRMRATCTTSGSSIFNGSRHMFNI